MSNMELFYAIGEVSEGKIEAADRMMRDPGRAAPFRRGALAWLTRPVAALLALVLISGITLSVYALEMNRRYNAAVGYLRSLGIEAEDLSDYSRAEVRQAAEWFSATEPAPASNSEKYMELYEKIYGKHEAPPLRPSAPAAVTSDEIRQLTPTMTLREVTALLGDTVDIGSGICILLYEVDEDYTLRISFAGIDAQLGVEGETLLKALQPK